MAACLVAHSFRAPLTLCCAGATPRSRCGALLRARQASRDRLLNDALDALADHETQLNQLRGASGTSSAAAAAWRSIAAQAEALVESEGQTRPAPVLGLARSLSAGGQSATGADEAGAADATAAAPLAGESPLMDAAAARVHIRTYEVEVVALRSALADLQATVDAERSRYMVSLRGMKVCVRTPRA